MKIVQTEINDIADVRMYKRPGTCELYLSIFNLTHFNTEVLRTRTESVNTSFAQNDIQANTFVFSNLDVVILK
jgi:hypothetical protein